MGKGKPILKKARELHGHFEVSADDFEYLRILSAAKEKFKNVEAPAMPLIEIGMTAESKNHSEGKPAQEQKKLQAPYGSYIPSRIR